MAAYHHVKAILNQCLSLFISYFDLHTLCHEETKLLLETQRRKKTYQA